MPDGLPAARTSVLYTLREFESREALFGMRSVLKPDRAGAPGETAPESVLDHLLTFLPDPFQAKQILVVEICTDLLVGSLRFGTSSGSYRTPSP